MFAQVGRLVVGGQGTGRPRPSRGPVPLRAAPDRRAPRARAGRWASSRRRKSARPRRAAAGLECRIRSRRHHDAHGRRQVLQQVRHRLVDRGGLGEVIVVEDEDEIPRQILEGVEEVAEQCGRCAPDHVRKDSTSAPATPVARAMAAWTYLQKVTGSASPASSDTHASAGADRASVALSHWFTSVVLPNPAGAETSVNAGRGDRSGHTWRRGRVTASGRMAGLRSLTVRTGRTASSRSSWLVTGNILVPAPKPRQRPRGAQPRRVALRPASGYSFGSVSGFPGTVTCTSICRSCPAARSWSAWESTYALPSS